MMSSSSPSPGSVPEILQKTPEAPKFKALESGISSTDTPRTASREDRIKAVKLAFNFK